MKILGMTVSQETYDEITHGEFFQGLKSLRHEMSIDLRSARNLAERIRDGEVKPDPEEPTTPVAIKTMLPRYPFRIEMEYLLFDIPLMESLPMDKIDEAPRWKTKDLPLMFVYCAKHNIDLFDSKRWAVSVHHNLWAMVDGVEVRLQDNRSEILIKVAP